MELPPFGSPTAEFRELHIELTYACNLKCRMCNIWNIYRNDPVMPRKEMSVEELVDYIDESQILKQLGGVVISGGEPFLKKDFTALCAYLLNSYPRASVGILSNLYNRELVISRLKELAAGIDRMWLGTSLDGLGELHNNTRGIGNAFQKFCRTLAALREEFPAFSVTVNYTLTTENYSGIYDAYAFCRTQGMDLSVQFPVPWEGAEKFSFAPEQLSKIETLLQRMMADGVADFEAGKIDERGLLAKLFYLDGLTDYQRNQRRVFDRCVAGRRFVNISPEGKVYFCPCLKHMLIGDLREKPFDEIWLGKEAVALRRKIDRRFCHCWLNCTIYPNASEALEEKKPAPVRGTPLQRLSGLFARS